MGKDMIPKKENELIEQPGGIIPEEEKTVKVLRMSSRDKGHDAGRMLAAAVQMFSAADIIGKVQKGIEYVVQVPVEHQAALQSGGLEMLHGSKSGKTWATLVKKLPTGKQDIVCNCPIAEQMRFQGNPVQGLTDVYQNMYMQQMLAQISAQVQEAYDAVLRVEQGQMDDRIGKLLSGRDDFVRALRNENAESRMREIELARSKISEAQGQIGQLFKSRIEAFKRVPESQWILLLKEITSVKTDYGKKQNDEFNRLQELFVFYQQATRLLAWTYSIVGDTERADMVFSQSIDFMNTIDFDRVKTLDHIYPAGDMSDAFYYHPAAYLKKEQTVCLEAAKPYRYVQMTVSGEELEEALRNDGRPVQEKDHR